MHASSPLAYAWRALAVANGPSIRQALPVAEASRRALMAVVRRGHVPSDDAMPDALTARHGGSPARGHEHLAVLPCDLARRGRIDTLLLRVSGGFPPEVHAALADLRTIRVRRDLALRVEPVALPEAPFRPSSTFESTTPFLCPRFPKLRGGRPRRDPEGRWIHGPEQQLRFLLAEQGLPEPLPLAAHDVRFGVWEKGRLIPWHRFDRERRHGGGRRGLSEGFGWRICFPCPIRGPIASGYASHFGLGQFHPV